MGWYVRPHNHHFLRSYTFVERPIHLFFLQLLTWTQGFLVGGFNPFEKYYSQIRSFPQIGMDIKIFELPPPGFRSNCWIKPSCEKVSRCFLIGWRLPTGWRNREMSSRFHSWGMVVFMVGNCLVVEEIPYGKECDSWWWETKPSEKDAQVKMDFFSQNRN